MGYLKSIGTVIIYIGLFLAVITFLPGLPPDAEYSEYSIKLPSDTQLQFELKNRLQGAEVLFSAEVKGPECFASYNGELYTGIRGGYVVKIEENRIKPIVKFGQKCDGLWQEEKCGRPLGLKFNDKGELFVADAYYGIFKMNVNTRHYVNIVNSSEPIDGKIPKLVNFLDIAKNGDIYWTDSSTDFRIHDGIYTFLANPSGRLIRYNAATKHNEVLVRNLGFANGILLSDDESFVIVLECLTSRIIKYNLKGPRAGQHEVFAEALPGLPDNVHSDGQGGFLVSLVLYVDSQHPFLPQSLIPHPYLRKMLSRLLYLIEVPFKLLQDVYPNYYAERVLHSVGSFDTSRILDVKKTSVILRMDKTGKVLDAIYSEDRKVNDISSAYIHNGYLWLGSPWKDCIMRVPLKQAFPDLAVNKRSLPNIKVEAKSINVKPTAQSTKNSPPKSTVKAQTQKSNSGATTSKSTTSQPSTTTSKPPSTTAAPITTTTPKPSTTVAPITTTTSTPHTSNVIPKEAKKVNAQGVKKDNLKEIKKDNSKEIKKDNSKEIKNDNSKEIKRDNPAKSEASKKSNEATVKPKSDDAIKKGAQNTQSAKSKPVEKKEDSSKK